MEITIKSEEFNFDGIGFVKDGKLVGFLDSENDIFFKAEQIHPYSAGYIVGQAVERFGAEGAHMVPAKWVVVEMPVVGDVHYDGLYEEWTVENVIINGQKAEYFGEANQDAAIDALCTIYQQECFI